MKSILKPRFIAVVMFLAILLVLPTVALAADPEPIAGTTRDGDWEMSSVDGYRLNPGETFELTGGLTIDEGSFLDLNGGTFIVDGPVTVNGTLNLNGGQFAARSAMNIVGPSARLIMRNIDDRLNVDGMMTVNGKDSVDSSGGSHVYDLSAGILAINSDFRQAGDYSQRSFQPLPAWAGGSLKAVLGAGCHNISFANPEYSWFTDIDFSAASLDKYSIVSVREKLNTDQEVMLGHLYFGGSLNGHKLTVNGSVHIPGGATFDLAGGKLKVGYDMTVGKDETLGLPAVSGQSAYLVMTNNADVVSVGGNFTIDSGSSAGNFTNGALVVGRKFTQKNTFANDSFTTGGTFKTVLLSQYPATAPVFASVGIGTGKSQFNELYLPAAADGCSTAGLICNVTPVHVGSGRVKYVSVNGVKYYTTDNSLNDAEIFVPSKPGAALDVVITLKDSTDSCSVYDSSTGSLVTNSKSFRIGSAPDKVLHYLIRIPVPGCEDMAEHLATHLVLTNQWVNTLSGMTVTAGTLVPAFSENITNYSLTLPYGTSSVTLKPVKRSAGETIVFGNATSGGVVTVSAGTTKKVTCTVTAADGVTKKVYTVTVMQPSAGGVLKGLKASAGSISPAFSPAKTAYSLPVAAGVGYVTITTSKTVASTTIKINGAVVGAGSLTAAKTFTVKPGVLQTVTMDVTAAGSSITVRYTVQLKPASAITSFSAAPCVGTKPTLSPGGTNRMTFTGKLSGAATLTLQVYKSGSWYTLGTKFAPQAGTYTITWDGKAGSAYLAPGSYPVRLLSVTNGTSAPTKTITVSIVPKPTVKYGTYASTFKADGISRQLCTFRLNYPSNVDVQVLNASGKAAATIHYTNLPASSLLYTKVMWNGKASPGNTAGLTGGTLAPAGAYTLRITAGGAVVSLPIKIQN